jgi:hypothetical protein
VLKGAQTVREKWFLRKALIVFQFTISLFFIICSIVIAAQLRYTREKDLGFTANAIITLDAPRGENPVKIKILAQQVRQMQGVQNVALQWLTPMHDNPRGMKLKFKSTDEKDFWVTQVAGDEQFIPLYNIQLLAGRNLEPADSVKELVINESLLHLMGLKDPAAALNKILYWNDRPYPVTGVVADFHTKSLHDPVTPLCIINRPDREGSIAVKLATRGKQAGVFSAALTQVEKKWKQIYPAAAFNYRFFDESLALLYEKDRQTERLINTSMLITIFISCIGLFALALFIAERRAKEISIRKVLGAGITNIMILLNKDFVILVAIALLIAAPIAWYCMDQWLQNFSYRITISWWIFLLAGVVILLIALTTVSFQAIKAAIENPVKNLRSE